MEISVQGGPETLGPPGSCNIARAIRDGEGAVPAASSLVLKGAAAGLSAGTLSPVMPGSLSRRSCSAVGADLRFSGGFVGMASAVGKRTEERLTSRFVQHWKKAGDRTNNQGAGDAPCAPLILAGLGTYTVHCPSALTQAGSPNPRNDRICITSSCPRQLVYSRCRRFP
jgi:hypothetical protein